MKIILEKFNKNNKQTILKESDINSNYLYTTVKKYIKEKSFPKNLLYSKINLMVENKQLKLKQASDTISKVSKSIEKKEKRVNELKKNNAKILSALKNHNSV